MVELVLAMAAGDQIWAALAAVAAFAASLVWWILKELKEQREQAGEKIKAQLELNHEIRSLCNSIDSNHAELKVSIQDLTGKIDENTKAIAKAIKLEVGG
jgi:uncharacterized protein HemX